MKGGEEDKGGRGGEGSRDDEVVGEGPVDKGDTAGGNGEILPSLLSPNLRPARKLVIVRREDGFEKRRVWRCGRCGVGVGYEVLREGRERGIDGVGVNKGEKDEGRVMYLLEGGLVETGEMGRGEDG